MPSIDKIKEQNRKRAQKLRNNKKKHGVIDLRVPLHTVEQNKLSKICEFFAFPDKAYSSEEALQSLIHRVYSEIPKIEADLGTCEMCGEQLPQGCAKLKEGGLFKGDSNCFHTINRVRIFEPSKEASL